MRKTRKAFTTIEVLVIVAIICILIALILPAIQQARNQSSDSAVMQSGKYRCIKTYVYNDNMRVDLESPENEITTMQIMWLNYDQNVKNAAKLESNNWYEIKSQNSFYLPVIKEVQKIADPTR